MAAQALSEWLLSEGHLHAALESPNDPWIARNRAELERSLAEVGTHLGWLVVTVNVAEGEVLLDGKPTTIGRSRVPAGRSVLQVRAAGHFPDIRAVEIVSGTETRIDVALKTFVNQPSLESAPIEAPPAVAAVTAPEIVRSQAESQPMTSARPNRLGPVVVGSLGVAAVAVGAYFGVRAIGDRDDRNKYCISTGCYPQGIVAYRNERDDALVSTVSFVAGGVAIATAVTWLILQNRSASGPVVSPVVLGRSFGLALSGSAW